MTGGPGGDVIATGPGRDVVHARDGERDVIDCGRGRDTVFADPEDSTERCELSR